MDRSRLPLNALRAFEAAARHGSMTGAGLELCVGQAAVSHQVRRLEALVGMALFRRLPRGLTPTDEGAALLPVVVEALDRMGAALDRLGDGPARETLTLGVVGTFATGWLLPRLADFHAACPSIDLRLMTNNNRVDLAGEGLDLAIRFGDGAWHATAAGLVLEAPLTPLCAPAIAARLADPDDLTRETLLRSYRADEWSRWFGVAGLACPAINGAMFDSSLTMAAAAIDGAGVALLPSRMFAAAIAEGRLVRPFAAEVAIGSYWLTRVHARRETAAMAAFAEWLRKAANSAD